MNGGNLNSEFVLIADNSVFGEPTYELPTDPDNNTLNIHTLRVAFPGARGLKYRQPRFGFGEKSWRIVRMDDTGTRFIAPSQGWGRINTFYVIKDGSANTSNDEVTNSPASTTFSASNPTKYAAPLVVKEATTSNSNSNVSAATSTTSAAVGKQKTASSGWGGQSGFWGNGTKIGSSKSQPLPAPKRWKQIAYKCGSGPFGRFPARFEAARISEEQERSSSGRERRQAAVDAMRKLKN